MCRVSEICMCLRLSQCIGRTGNRKVAYSRRHFDLSFMAIFIFCKGFFMLKPPIDICPFFFSTGFLSSCDRFVNLLVDLVLVVVVVAVLLHLHLICPLLLGLFTPPSVRSHDFSTFRPALRFCHSVAFVLLSCVLWSTRRLGLWTSRGSPDGQWRGGQLESHRN